MSANLMETLLKTRAHLLGATLLAFLASLLMAAPAMAGAQVPRTISNVATIGWDVGAQRFERSSNQVDVDVVPSEGAVLETLRLTDGTFSPAILGGTCGAAVQREGSGGGDTAAPPLSSYGMVVTSELVRSPAPSQSSSR